MNRVEVSPAVPRGTLDAPPSKSYTHRELVASFFAQGPSELVGPLVSDDTLATGRGLRQMGARVTWRPRSCMVRPAPPGTARSHRQITVDCGASGTTLRFLAAVAATRQYPVRLVGSAGLARRPLSPLLDFLEGAGASIRRASHDRSVPVTICGPVQVGRGSLDGSESSQFISALLLSLPSLSGLHRLRVLGTAVSAPYIEATLEVLRRRGVRWTVAGRNYGIRGPARFRPGRVRVPGDASSAAYLWAAAALAGGAVRVRGIPRRPPQADLRILGILRRMGARVFLRPDGAQVIGGRLRAVSVDLTDAPDLFPLVGVLAAHSAGESRILGAAQAVNKESDRRQGTAELIRASGGTVALTRSSLDVRPAGRAGRLEWSGSEDHRLVMSAAVAALVGSRPSRIGDARAVEKSYPQFWRALRSLGVRVERVTA